MLGELFRRKAARREVRVLPQDTTLELAPGQSILEAALARGLRYPHNCTVGTCGSCKTLLEQGRVKAASDFGYVLSRRELEAGYILACQAMPLDEVTVVRIADPGADKPAPQGYRGQIVASDDLTHDIRKVVVQLDRAMPYVAGQYVEVKAAAMPRPRNYSLADSPRREGRDRLTFIIRRVAGGAFTEALFTGRLQGAELEVNGPHGEFHLRPGDAPMLCVVGGSGLGPVFALLEDMRNRRVRRSVRLLCGARTRADLYYLDELAQLGRGLLEPFELTPVLSHEPADSPWTGARGMVTELIAGDLSGHQAYLCGPPPMVDTAIDAVTRHGMQLESIYYDKFTDGRDP